MSFFNKESTSEPVVVNIGIESYHLMLISSNFFCCRDGGEGEKSLPCTACCIAQLAQCFGGFFHLKDLIFVILREWVLNVICQEAKRFCYFLSRLEFYSNNSIYQEEDMKNCSELSCARF